MVKKSIITLRSQALNGNIPGDSVEREIIVYTPDNIKAKAPLLIGLAPFGVNHINFVGGSALSETLEDIILRLYQNEKLNGAVIAIPNCFTRYGGNQYINSSAVGMYENFIVQELIPQLRTKFDTAATGLFGKGSGGFGAYTLASRNPGAINGFAAHSMDAGFEYAYLPDFPTALEEFRRTGSPSKWLEKFYQKYNRIRSDLIKTLSIINYAAFYSPDPASLEMGISFPFDWINGHFNQEVWSKWLLWDPAKNVSRFSRQMEMMKFIYFDVGVQDEFALTWGSRAVDTFLADSKINHTYEEYEDGHFGTVYRMEKSLAMMAAALG